MRALQICKQLIERDFLEERDAKNLQNCVEAGIEFEALLDDGNQHIDRDRDPDLGAHRVLAEAEERFDAQVLLDPTKEQLDLPAAAIEVGDGARGQAQYEDIARDWSRLGSNR